MENVKSPLENTEGPDNPERYMGYTLQDPLGQKVGKVESIFVNRGGMPEYVRVKLGSFGLKSVLIPVLSLKPDEARRTLTLE
ncbi:MAG: hypothetical protein WA982_03535 [Rubrobacteraceae bacterium]